VDAAADWHTTLYLLDFLLFLTGLCLDYKPAIFVCHSQSILIIAVTDVCTVTPLLVSLTQTHPLLSDNFTAAAGVCACLLNPEATLS